MSIEIKDQDRKNLQTLLSIMAALRDPVDGCPWDVKQTFASITPYTIEEAYEVVDAIERNDMGDLCDELGDLLLQVVFHARIAEEQQSFDFSDVVEAICSKMIRRHPHVFGSPQERGKKPKKGFWEEIKALEKGKTGKGVDKGDDGEHLLDSVPTTLPALSRANKMQSKAARVGFDWPDAAGVYDKINEEIAEIKAAETPEDIGEELGDLLFTVVNLTRHMGHDPEKVLRQANTKFQRRFNEMENLSCVRLDQVNNHALEALWQKAKNTPSR